MMTDSNARLHRIRRRLIYEGVVRVILLVLLWLCLPYALGLGLAPSRLRLAGLLFLFVLLSTWKRGSVLVAEQRRKLDIPMAAFLSSTHPEIPRVAGTAVYLTADPTMVPSAGN